MDSLCRTRNALIKSDGNYPSPYCILNHCKDMHSQFYIILIYDKITQLLTDQGGVNSYSPLCTRQKFVIDLPPTLTSHLLVAASSVGRGEPRTPQAAAPSWPGGGGRGSRRGRRSRRSSCSPGTARWT